MIVGYKRVSTVQQSGATQDFAELNLDRIYTDRVSGAIPFAERPAAQRLLEDARSGKVKEIHVHSVDRLGRDSLDIQQTLYELAEIGVQVHVKREALTLLTDDGKISPTTQIVLAVMSAIAQIDRQLIRERTIAGIEKAKIEGKYLGRRPGSFESSEKFLAKPKNARALSLLSEGLPMAYVAKIVGLSPTTVRKVRDQGLESGALEQEFATA